MKLKFKIQAYQTAAVASVVDCFAGQPMTYGRTYRIDPGNKAQFSAFDEGFRNADLALSDAQMLENIQKVQRRQHLSVSRTLTDFTTCDNKGTRRPAKKAYTKMALEATRIHLDVEMETATGKSYCYIKTLFELNQRYGWSKFIIMVPSIAIREGVYKSLEITAEHFQETYGKKARFFIYNSRQLHTLESFSSDAGINVMVINIQAFNAGGKDNRRIYEELDDFQSRRPIDVIASNRPILILDEPQKMQGDKTMAALPKFKPLMILRYSATHRTTHNKIHRLDALDAYNQKLVKKIAVRGISVNGLSGTNAYLYLESIAVSTRAPVARMEIEVRRKSGITRTLRRLEKGDNLHTLSGELDQYHGFVIADIDAITDTVEFTNGHRLHAGQASGDMNEATLRRIQIRETIKAHLEKERILFARGVKVLSLFFIDAVVKYRDYSRDDEQGEYARIFAEEYARLRAEYLDEPTLDNQPYREYLSGIDVERTHDGYFSIDKKTRKLTDPGVRKRGESAGLSDDVDAYDLILKDKERLLSFAEPVRFIFSHSALREGWDNPNVFVMCMLKHSDNTLSRRQEVGRGLRIAVNQLGERQDDPATVHQTNVLTVVASESYRDFVAALQKDIGESLSERPRKADAAFFTDKTLAGDRDPIEVSEAMARQIYRYLVKNDYTDDTDQLTEAWHEARTNGTLAPLSDALTPYAQEIFALIDSVFSNSRLPDVGDDRRPKTNPLNANFEKKAFQALWHRINRKAIYRVAFDSAELIRNGIAALDKELRVPALRYTIQSGVQDDCINDNQLESGAGFTVTDTAVATDHAPSHSRVSYDLIGKIAANTQLTRVTLAEILRGVRPETFAQFKQNPAHFITECARLINEQKATAIIERLSYNRLAETHDSAIFTAAQSRQDFSKAGEKLKKHIYDYAIADSGVEREFVNELDTSAEVVVYAKLPRGFYISTPVGDYNPDWAVFFREGVVRHIYFVAETKGALSSMELRKVEQTKIECARRFFAELNHGIAFEQVKYDVVTNYGQLMELVGAATVTPDGEGC